MNAVSISENDSFVQGLADWLVAKGCKPSSASKIKYRLGGRGILAKASLVCLIEAVSRVALCCGLNAGSISMSCLFSILSPKDLVHSLPNTRLASDVPIEPQGILTSKVREYRIRQGTELIADKLRKEFEYAENQAAQEPDKAFQYLAAPASFKGHTQSERIAGREVGICHYIGRRPTMEDEHLATAFTLHVGGREYPVQLFGVFDGHGGGEASCYVRDHLERKLHETLNEFCLDGLSDEAIWNALKMTFVRLSGEFSERRSGTTATVAMILDGKLWTANVGDSRTILDTGVQLSEDAKPTDPRYSKGIENRGGGVYFGRVNGMLAVARAVGDHDVGAISARPKITVYPLSMIPSGSHLILACDGIYDVASTRQVAASVREHGDQPAAEMAKNIVYSAYQAGSGDNLSALVVKF